MISRPHPAGRSPVPFPHALAAVLLALGLAGCGSGSAPATFDLTAVTAPRIPRGGSIVVAEPVSLQVFEGDRIIIKDAGGGVSFVGGGQWADRLPRLIQTRIIQTLENSGRLGTVSRPGDRITADRALVTEIRAFEVSVATGEAVADISAKLVSDATNRVVSARVFQARVPVSKVDAGSAAQALDRALATVLTDLARWIGTGR